MSMQMLKASFLENQVPSPEEKQELSEQLKLPLEQVIVWPAWGILYLDYLVLHRLCFNVLNSC
jgi:hypothetical protein